MLVLSRKQGERIVVGDNVTITVTKCGRNRVVLGIDAPKEVPVKRGELIREEQTPEECHPPVPSAIRMEIPLPMGVEFS